MYPQTVETDVRTTDPETVHVTPLRSFKPLAILALATIALAVLVPFAPVRADRVEVTWPKAGSGVESTVAMFLPYRPLRMDVTASCAAVANAPASGERTVFSTFPRDAQDGKQWGMALLARDRGLVLSVAGQERVLGAAPSGACEYRLHAEGDRLTVSVNGRELISVETLVPQVIAFVSDLTEGVSANVQADTRFQTAPAPLKIGLMIGCGVGIIACFVAAFRRFRPTPPAPRRRVPLLPDALWTVLAASGIVAWGIVGPQTVDDGWFLAMHRNFGPSGFIGDYHAALNAPEAPAVLMQLLFAPLFQVSWAPLMTRVPAMLAGFGIWLLLLAIVRLVHRYTDAPRVPTWLLGFAFFVAWMPPGIGLRPEPYVALCTALSAYGAVRARLTEAPAWLLLSGLAVGLGFTVTSTGALALIPLVLGLLYVYRRIVAGRARWLLALLVLACAAVASPIVFHGAGLGGVLDAAGARYWYGASLSWFEEFTRYQMLLGSTGPDFLFEQHPYKRLPVLLGIVLLLVVGGLWLRNRKDSVYDGVYGWPFAWLGVSLLLLVFSPTKIAAHFGALSFYLALVLAFGLAGLSKAFERERAGWVVRLLTLFAITFVVSLSWDGANAWWAYNQYGIPKLNGRLFEGVPANPVVLLVTGGVLAGVFILLRRTETSVPLRLTGLTAIAIAGVSVVVMPVLTGGLLVKAAMNQESRDGWSETATNLASLGTGSCGAADKVEVEERRSLSDLIARTPGPTLVDWPISVWYPCVTPPVLVDGMAQPPTLMVVANDPYRTHGELTRSRWVYAGPYAGLSSVATYREVPATMRGESLPGLWGTVWVPEYRYRTDGFDMRKSVTEQPGWHREPSLATKEYAGRVVEP